MILTRSDFAFCVCKLISPFPSFPSKEMGLESCHQPSKPGSDPKPVRVHRKIPVDFWGFGPVPWFFCLPASGLSLKCFSDNSVKKLDLFLSSKGGKNELWVSNVSESWWKNLLGIGIVNLGMALCI